MPTNQQRRDEERRRLKRELQQRREREVARKRVTLIVSIVTTVALAAAVVVIVLVATSGSDKKKQPAATKPTTATTAPTSPAAPTSSAPAPPKASGPAVTFNGVTVKGAADLKGEPVVSSTAKADPPKLQYKDLVVGKGAAAAASKTATVQYYVAFYKGGKYLDSSWQDGQAYTTPLSEGSSITGFIQGIAGTTGIAPMKVGGRRVVIIPAALAYGKDGDQGVPPNTPLVFVIDLTKIA